MTSRRKIILLLTVLIILSGLAGTCVGIRIGKMQARKRSIPEAWNVAAMHLLQRKLSLTAEQAQTVQQILDAGADELRTIRSDTLARTDQVVDRAVHRIEPTLTAEQLPIFQKLVQERAQASLEMLNVSPSKGSR